ncbi:1164_t:CDS:1, partial [Cetraspora pellucida]
MHQQQGPQADFFYTPFYTTTEIRHHHHLSDDRNATSLLYVVADFHHWPICELLNAKLASSR